MEHQRKADQTVSADCSNTIIIFLFFIFISITEDYITLILHIILYNIELCLTTLQYLTLHYTDSKLHLPRYSILQFYFPVSVVVVVFFLINLWD